MVYFRTYARSVGCDVDSLGDLAVWNYILAHQGKTIDHYCRLRLMRIPLLHDRNLKDSSRYEGQINPSRGRLRGGSGEVSQLNASKFNHSKRIRL